MPITIRRDAALLPIVASRVKVSDVVRPLRTIKTMEAGVLRTVASFVQPLTASASPASMSGYVAGGAGDVVSNTVTVTPSGGLAPFSYSWVQLTGSAVAISGASSATAGVSKYFPNTDSTVTGTVRWTVADSSTPAQSVTGTIPFTLTHERNTGGA